MAPSIMLVDDHTIIRRGLRNLLARRYPGMDIADASSLKELKLSLRHTVPQMLLLDLQLGDGNAMDELEEFRATYPALRILVYTMSPEHIYAQRVLALGCAGYLTKESSEDEVLRAVAVVKDGGTYISHETEMRLLERSMDPLSAIAMDPFLRLSARELRVMDELLAGAGVKETATRMNLNPSTVATYKARLFDKLGVSTLMDLQRLAKVHRYKPQ